MMEIKCEVSIENDAFRCDPRAGPRRLMRASKKKQKSPNSLVMSSLQAVYEFYRKVYFEEVD